MTFAAFSTRGGCCCCFFWLIKEGVLLVDPGMNSSFVLGQVGHPVASGPWKLLRSPAALHHHHHFTKPIQLLQQQPVIDFLPCHDQIRRNSQPTIEYSSLEWVALNDSLFNTGPNPFGSPPLDSKILRSTNSYFYFHLYNIRDVFKCFSRNELIELLKFQYNQFDFYYLLQAFIEFQLKENDILVRE